MKKVLVVNAGSSSLKYMLFDMQGEKMLCKGLVERIGIAGSRLVYSKAGADKIVKEMPIANHVAAIKANVQKEELITADELRAAIDDAGFGDAAFFKVRLEAAQ